MIVGPTFFSSPSGGDPYWGDVILLLHFEDAPGTTLPLDSSSFSQALSASTAGLETTNAASLYGSGSLESVSTIAGNGGRLGFIPGAHADSEEWTIEFSLYPFSILNWNFGFGFSNSNGYIILAGPLDGANSGKIQVSNSGVVTLVSATTITLNAWTHVALTRGYTSPGVYTARLFINGIKEAESTSGAPPFVSGVFWAIGETDSAGFSALNGYLDEFRLTTACRYTADFTPPTASYPNGF